MGRLKDLVELRQWRKSLVWVLVKCFSDDTTLWRRRRMFMDAVTSSKFMKSQMKQLGGTDESWGQRWKQAKSSERKLMMTGCDIYLRAVWGCWWADFGTVDEQWSIGDFVLTLEELGAMMMIDSIVRVDSWRFGRRKSGGNWLFSDGANVGISTIYTTRGV